MLDLYTLRTGERKLQLLRGDIKVLSVLLPDQAVLLLLSEQGTVDLNCEDAHKLLATLNNLELSTLSREFYSRDQGEKYYDTEVGVAVKLICFLEEAVAA